MRPNLLLIEDDPISLDIIRALCERRGFAVDAVGDGFGGLRLLREKTYAVALVDYHLPEMDGFALARLMRDLSGPDLPLIGITADQKGLAARRGADALFDAILPKPVTENVLARTLETGARVRRPGAAAEKAVQADEKAPTRSHAHAAYDTAATLWRRLGLEDRPRVLPCPRPTQVACEALSHAFLLVEAATESQVILLLGTDGLPLIEEAQLQASHPLPVIALTDGLRAHAGETFRVDDLESWARVAALLRRHDTRTAPELAATEAIPAPDGAQLQAERVGASSLVLALHEASRGQERPKDLDEGVTDCRLPKRESLRARADRILFDDGHGLTGAIERAVAARPSTAAITDPFGGDLAGINHEHYAELVSILGRDRVLALMEMLAAQCARSLEAGSHRVHPEALADYAHQMISSAGLLGFTELSNACQHLEATVRQGGDATTSVAAVRTAYQRTTKIIASLRYAA